MKTIQIIALISLLLIGYSCSSVHRNYNKIRFQRNEISKNKIEKTTPQQKKELQPEMLGIVDVPSKEIVVKDTVYSLPASISKIKSVSQKQTMSHLKKVDFTQPHDTIQKKENTVLKRNEVQKLNSKRGKIYFFVGLAFILIMSIAVILSFYAVAEAFGGIAILAFLLGYIFMFPAFLKLNSLKKDLKRVGLKLSHFEGAIYVLSFIFNLLPVFLLLLLVGYIITSY